MIIIYNSMYLFSKYITIIYEFKFTIKFFLFFICEITLFNSLKYNEKQDDKCQYSGLDRNGVLDNVSVVHVTKLTIEIKRQSKKG